MKGKLRPDIFFLRRSWKGYRNISPSFTSYLKRPIHTGDDTMLWPVLIIKLTVKGKVGSCLNISVGIQTKWHFLKYQHSNAVESNAKVSDYYFSNLCPAWGRLLPWFNCSHWLSCWQFLQFCFTKPHFLISWLFCVTLGHHCHLCLSGSNLALAFSSPFSESSPPRYN